MKLVFYTILILTLSVDCFDEVILTIPINNYALLFSINILISCFEASYYIYEKKYE